MKTLKNLFSITLFFSFILSHAQDSSGIYYAAGVEKNKMGDNCGAIRLFDKAIRFHPSDSAYYFRGQLKSFVFDTKGAVSDYTKGMRLKTKEYYNLLSDRATLLYLMGHYRRAIKDYSYLLKMNKFGADYGLNSAIDSVRIYKSEIFQLRKIRNKDALLYAKRGRAYFRLGHYTAAFRDLNKAIALNPHNSRLYFTRAMCEAMSGNRTRAYSDFLKAGNLGDTEAIQFQKYFCIARNH